MSGSASRGMRFTDQIPVITSRKLPVNTRNRLLAHHSMIQLITLHPSCGVHRELLVCNHTAVLASDKGNLPTPASSTITIPFVQTIPFAGHTDLIFHTCPSH